MESCEELLIVESLISHARAFLENNGFDWYVCGGGAIDVFLGKQSGVIHELFDKQQPFEKRNLFCFTSNENRCRLEPIGDERYRFGLEKREQKDLTYIEFLFNQRDDEYFYLPGNENLKRKLNKALLKSNGVPYLAPDIVLFYKSRYLEYSPDTFDHYQDFDLSLPFLNEEQKQWLRESLENEYANEHVWLQRL